MRAPSDLAHEVKFKPLKENLYSVQLSCLRDWERVTQEGPWHFRGDVAILKPCKQAIMKLQGNVSTTSKRSVDSTD